MALWKLTLSYDGTAFQGWQVQPGRPTVQGTLAEALQRVTGEAVLPQGSGRTDAGVHALGQVAGFELDVEIPAENLHHALNRALPPSIRVLAAAVAPPGFHARHSARGKSYEYRIFPLRDGPLRDGPLRDGLRADGIAADRICPPFLAPYVWACHWQVDLDCMAAAAADVCGTHDFTSFAASDPDRAHREHDTAALDNVQTSDRVRSNDGVRPTDNVRTITRSSLTREAELLVYRVAGNGFLHHMVRNLVGTLVEIGRGALPPDAIPGILAARSRAAAGPTAPASGLFLVSVDYPVSLVGEVQP